MLQGETTSVRNFKIKSKATAFLERHRVCFCGLCFEIIKHNQYEVLRKTTLNMDKAVKIDTTQRLDQLLQALASACAC